MFVGPERAKDVFAALPDAIGSVQAQLRHAETRGHIRLWWEDTPIDIFLDVHPFHREVANSVRQVHFSGRLLPVVGCTALAVFKALLNRAKDWEDIEEMVAIGEIGLVDALAWAAQIVGANDPALVRLTALPA